MKNNNDVLFTQNVEKIAENFEYCAIIITFILMLLKFAGIINYSWPIVLSLLWVPEILIIASLAILGILGIFTLKIFIVIISIVKSISLFTRSK